MPTRREAILAAPALLAAEPAAPAYPSDDDRLKIKNDLKLARDVISGRRPDPGNAAAKLGYHLRKILQELRTRVAADIGAADADFFGGERADPGLLARLADRTEALLAEIDRKP